MPQTLTQNRFQYKVTLWRTKNSPLVCITNCFPTNGHKNSCFKIIISFHKYNTVRTVGKYYLNWGYFCLKWSWQPPPPPPEPNGTFALYISATCNCNYCNMLKLHSLGIRVTIYVPLLYRNTRTKYPYSQQKGYINYFHLRLCSYHTVE